MARCLRDGISFSDAQRRIDAGETDFEWETVTIPNADTNDEMSLLKQKPGAKQLSRWLILSGLVLQI